MPFKLEKVKSHDDFEKTRPTQAALPVVGNEAEIRLNCPMPILEAFRALLKDSKILGTSYENPYTGQIEHFPKEAKDLTPRHLQILARNEYLNTSGNMAVDLYDDLLTEDQIASIRCLVKATTLAGVVYAQAYGGYGGIKYQPLAEPLKTIIIDQSGFQWQWDFRNTGGLFFYPDDPKAAALPPGYAQWQQAMYSNMFLMKERPTVCSKNSLPVSWRGVSGLVSGSIDLDQLAQAFGLEFKQALEAAVAQGDAELGPDEKINFKFLRAGLGCFAEGILPATDTGEAAALARARLEGIRDALYNLKLLPADMRYLGKVKGLELPFSGLIGAETIIQDIAKLAQELGLEWGGTPNQDALMPREGYVNATTNCGDPHAQIGNEGEYLSVDATIASNAPGVYNLRVGYNLQIKEVCIDINESVLTSGLKKAKMKAQAQAQIFLQAEAQPSQSSESSQSSATQLREPIVEIAEIAEIAEKSAKSEKSEKSETQPIAEKATPSLTEAQIKDLEAKDRALNLKLKRLNQITWPAGVILAICVAGLGLAMWGPLGVIFGVAAVGLGVWSLHKKIHYDIHSERADLYFKPEWQVYVKLQSAKANTPVSTSTMAPPSTTRPSLEDERLSVLPKLTEKSEKGVDEDNTSQKNKKLDI